MLADVFLLLKVTHQPQEHHLHKSISVFFLKHDGVKILTIWLVEAALCELGEVLSLNGMFR